MKLDHYQKLRRLGVLKKRRGLPQISEAIYELMKPDYDAITDGLRGVLGEDCSGPEWTDCNCRGCRQKS